MPVPELMYTERLLLRPFHRGDAAALRGALDDPAIAAGVLGDSCPSTPEDALDWILRQEEGRRKGTSFVYAVCERDTGILAGAAGLRVNAEHAHAELGYWICRPFRGRGYAREAVSALLELGFFGLGLHRVYARHLAWNAPSARVLSATGFRHEGTLAGHALWWGTFHDVEVYGICVADYLRDYVSRSGTGWRDGRDDG
ncbi:MAG: GNAT family N-acetyltransferase [Methanolinea sp.]|nr:GNAT family N-acetyltransferase [Methanolinea sp.]